MERLQISLSETQYDFLKSEAFVTGKSMAAVLRAMINEVIAQRQQDLLQNDPIWDMVGVGQEIEGPTDISANVDTYLYGEPLETSSSILPMVAETPDESDEYHVD